MSSIIILMLMRSWDQHFSSLKIPNSCLLFRILRNKIGSLGGPGSGHSSLHSASHFPVKQSSASASSSLVASLVTSLLQLNGSTARIKIVNRKIGGS